MNRKNRLLMPLLAAAAASVVTFAGIGVAAITGHLPMNPMSPNPVAGLIGASAKGPAVEPAATTRSRTAKPSPAKPIDFRKGSRVAARKIQCDSCGVVDSIRAREVENPGVRTSDYRSGVRDDGREFSGRAPEIEYAALARIGDPRVAVNFVVTVRMEDGTVRTIYENQRPPFSIGERVRLVNGAVMPLG